MPPEDENESEPEPAQLKEPEEPELPAPPPLSSPSKRSGKSRYTKIAAPSFAQQKEILVLNEEETRTARSGKHRSVTAEEHRSLRADPQPAVLDGMEEVEEVLIRRGRGLSKASKSVKQVAVKSNDDASKLFAAVGSSSARSDKTFAPKRFLREEVEADKSRAQAKSGREDAPPLIPVYEYRVISQPKPATLAVRSRKEASSSKSLRSKSQ